MTFAAALLATVGLAALTAHPAAVPAQAPARPATAGDRAAERIKALHRESELLAGQERTLIGDIRHLEIERDLRLEEVSRLQAESAAVAARIEETNRQIVDLEASIAAARPGLDARLVDVYKLGRPGYARVALGVARLRDIGRATRLVGALAQLDHRRVQAFTAQVGRLSQAKASLVEHSTTLRALQADARASADLAAKAAAARETLVKQIDDRRDLNAQLAGELETAAQKLQKTLMSLPGTTPSGELVVLPIKPFRGALDWPFAGRVRSGYGRRPARLGATPQNGIEIESVDGRPVTAVHDGRVAFADVFPGLGQLVILDHGGLAFSLYGYLGSMSVAKGAAVSHGQAIGTAGRAPAGNSSVYFELRIDGQPVDPLQWLKEGR